MSFFRQSFRLIVGLFLVWPFAGLQVQISGAQASEDGITVRPIGGLSGFVTETIQWKVLELALEKSGRAYDLAPSKYKRLVEREANQMRDLGDEGNLIWAGPIHPQNAEMLPIGIPFLFGLPSYRYLWVRKSDVGKFSQIRTIDDLRQFSILTGQNWGANYILEAEGFNLRKGYSANLPNMLMAGRGEVLLWPVTGVFNMYEQFGVEDLEMTPVPNVLVRLPQVFFFWVADEGSQDLYDAVYSGLSAALADGSLDQLIRDFPRVGDAYSNLVSNEFVIIDIENPDLSEKVRSDLEVYGLDVGELGPDGANPGK